MTCIVGYVDEPNNCVYIGGDSLGSNSCTKALESQSKVFHHHVFKNVVMGVCGSFRKIDLLKYSEKLFPEADFYKKTKIDHAYMVKTFIPNLINLFQNNVYDCAPEKRGGNFLLGVGSSLFEIQSDYSVLQPSSGFAAVGIGEEVAIGSIYTLDKHFKNISPIEKIKYSLEASEDYNCGVQRPFIILNTKNEKEVRIE